MEHLQGAHRNLALIVSVTIAFRNTSCYDRWYEGRKLVGQVTNYLREVCLEVRVFGMMMIIIIIVIVIIIVISIAFRNTSCYDRWYEGRKLVGHHQLPQGGLPGGEGWWNHHHHDHHQHHHQHQHHHHHHRYF
jgi:predicted membrane chloride channel (bestrophin family)